MLLALSVGAVYWPALRGVVVLLDIVGLCLVLMDFASIPRLAGLELRRRIPLRAGLSQPFTRTLEIAHPASRANGLHIAVYEEFSDALEVDARTRDGMFEDVVEDLDPTAGPDTGRLSADGAEGLIKLARTYVSRRRGRAWLGDMRVRVRGPLGLIERQTRRNGESTLDIEPPLLGLSQTLRLAASNRWHDLGVRRVRRRGGLTEFESLRDYVPGDDVRLVDWKAFARRGRPSVRQYQEERGQELLLVIDCGRRMGATTADGDERAWSKLDHALDAGLQLAAVALAKGDRVGVVAFDAEVRLFVPPARGAKQLARLREAVFDLLPTGREANLERALREIAARHPRRAMLLVISDVADPLSVAAQRTALGAGRRHHRVLFASLDDPGVRRAAQGEAAVPVLVRAAALALAEERRRALQELAGSGARVLDALPAEAAAPMLAAWLDARRSGLN